jgi:hypothetical protein
MSTPTPFPQPGASKGKKSAKSAKSPKRAKSPKNEKSPKSAKSPKNEKSPKRSTVRHTRAIQRDRTKRPCSPPLAVPLVEHLTEIVHPATLAQLDHFHRMGLRARVLTLPVMVALLLMIVWRQIPSVGEVVRLLAKEGLLWTGPLVVSQQALSARLCVFPAVLFLNVLEAILPAMHARFEQRQRPVPPAIAWVRARYTAVMAGDGSVLDALMRRVGLLRDAPKAPLAGRIFALVDLASCLPRRVTYHAKALASDHTFWPTILAAVPAGALLVLDAGFNDFGRFLALTAGQVTFVIRPRSNLVWQLERVLTLTPTFRDRIVWIGEGETRQQVRLIEVLVGRKWYRYLTNEQDAARLPAHIVCALYAQRWRIEDAFAIVKRLLGLAYFWVGSENGIQLQVWATWLVYACLVDLTDAVAEALQRPFAQISLEMVYRGLYHYTQAYHRGEATDVVDYLAQNARLLGLIKRDRKKQPPAPGENSPPADTLPGERPAGNGNPQP